MAKKDDHLPAEARERLARMIAEEKAHAKKFEKLDEEVAKRAELVLAEATSTAKIAKMASELAERGGLSMEEIAQHVLVMDKRTRKTRPISRQGLTVMVAVHDGRREAKTTRASRRRRGAVEAAPGRLNLEALQ